MKKAAINILKYVLLFVLFFSIIQFLCPELCGDSIYNYGFSYAIYRGEIPYLDFNMIIPPFGAFFYAIFFFIFGNSYYLFNLTQAFLLCVFCHYLYKLYGVKSYLFLVPMCSVFLIPFIYIIFPGYNFLLLLELVILLYCEKENKNDYGIGFLLGISFLTKQTVGFCFALVSMYYIRKDFKKIFHRMIGFSIPCLIFLFYLLITKSFSSFFDMCFLGMFDFVNINGRVIDTFFVLFLLGFIYLIVCIVKNPKDIQLYYVLAFSTIAVPLYDFYHVCLFLFAICLLLIRFISVPINDNSLFNVHFFLSCFFVSLFSILLFSFFYHDFSLNANTSFQGMMIGDYGREQALKINEFIQKHKDDNLILIGGWTSYVYKIINHMNIDYYDLLNYGNHGYHGTEKVIAKIQQEKDPIFIFDTYIYEKATPRNQVNRIVMDYVYQHYVEKERIGDDYIVFMEE